MSEAQLHDGTANFFGVESSGVWQIRGNGALTLLDDRLRFERLLPRWTLEIPNDRMRRVEVVASHLGKTVGQRLLKVSFVDEAGADDSVAFYVADVDRWVEALAPRCG